MTEGTALGREAEAVSTASPPSPTRILQSHSLTPFSNSVDCTAELFIKTAYNENIPFLYSMNPCNFLPPPGQRPLGQESLRKKKLKGKAVKAKKTIDKPWLWQCRPSAPFPGLLWHWHSRARVAAIWCMDNELRNTRQRGEGNQMNSELRCRALTLSTLLSLLLLFCG